MKNKAPDSLWPPGKPPGLLQERNLRPQSGKLPLNAWTLRRVSRENRVPAGGWTRGPVPAEGRHCSQEPEHVVEEEAACPELRCWRSWPGRGMQVPAHWCRLRDRPPCLPSYPMPHSHLRARRPAGDRVGCACVQVHLSLCVHRCERVPVSVHPC